MSETKRYSRFAKKVSTLPTPGVVVLFKNLNEKSCAVLFYYAVAISLSVFSFSLVLLENNAEHISLVTGFSFLGTLLSGLVLGMMQLLSDDRRNVRQNITKAAEAHVENLKDPNAPEVKLSAFVTTEDGTYSRHFASGSDEEYLENLSPRTIQWVERYFNRQVKKVQEEEKSQVAEQRKSAVSLNAIAIDAIVSNEGRLDKSIQEHVAQ